MYPNLWKNCKFVVPVLNDGGSQQIKVSVTRECGYYANTIPAIGQNSEVIRYATISRGSQQGTGCLAGGFVIVPCVVTLTRAGGGSRQIEVSVTRERGYYANTIPAIIILRKVL